VAQCPAVALLQEQAEVLLEITPLIIAEAVSSFTLLVHN
jgi:hypothetical protein